MRSVAALVFAVLALVVSAYNTVPVQAPARPVAATPRVAVSPVAATNFYDPGLDNPEVRARAPLFPRHLIPRGACVRACRSILALSFSSPRPPHHAQIPDDYEAQPPRKCASCFG